MHKRVYDLIVIGCGISGIGVALEAARRGYSVLVVERGRVFQGASSNSLRIIHGGFRYLQSFSIARILDSIKAQKQLLANWPQFIKPLPCLFPIAASGIKSKVPLSAANLFYNGILKALSAGKQANRILDEKSAEERLPFMQGRLRHGALYWEDAVISDPPGFHKALLEEFYAVGGGVESGTEVKQVLEEDGLLKVNPAAGDGYFGRYVINASGAGVHKIEVKVRGYNRHMLSWCKAFNLVIKRQLSESCALGVESTDAVGKKRLYFFVPRGDGTAFGTEYALIKDTSSKAEVGESEKLRMLQETNNMLGLNLTAEDVSSVEAGVLPCVERNGGFNLLGREKIYKYGHYLEIISTKYTTFETQAKRVIDLL